LVIGHWSLVISHPLVIGHSPVRLFHLGHLVEDALGDFGAEAEAGKVSAAREDGRYLDSDDAFCAGTADYSRLGRPDLLLQ
jgi:hypothetical protein